MAEDRDLRAYLEPLALPRGRLFQLTRDFAAAYRHLALTSDDQFLATPVSKLPTGAERGEFLAIDLGGSNLRVAFINLLGPIDTTTAEGRRFSLTAYDERIEKYCQRSWPIGDNLKHERAEDLFAWIGDCLAEVIRARFEDDEVWPEEIPLGITFSFPMKQNTLSEATLMPMGKGFKITSNPDLGSMVLAGYARHTQPINGASDGHSARPLPHIKLTAISNDSVATLISLSYTTNAKPNSKAAIGLILGTGTNAAVPMRPADLHADKVAYATGGAPAEQIVVNTEWTIRGVAPALAANQIPTRWDEQLDAALSTPGFQPFEYMTAGTYLGEVIRFAVREYLVERAGVPPADLPPALSRSYGLNTSWLGHHVSPANDLAALAEKLNSTPELAPPPASSFRWTPALADVLRQTERAVLQRSTALVAAAITALLEASGEVHLAADDGAALDAAPLASPISPVSPVSPSGRELVVAYCGGLICLYHGYLERLKRDLRVLRPLLAEKGVVVTLREASEGGVIGAGVLAGTVSPGAVKGSGM